MSQRLHHPPGILADLADYVGRVSPRHQPLFNAAGALVALSALSGNKFTVQPTVNALNLYVLLEAESGGGKSGPRDAVTQLHLEINLAGQLLATPASAPALLKHLGANDEVVNPNRFISIDEFGKFLTQAQRPGTHYAELVTELVRLWEMGCKYLPPRAYANENATIPGIQRPFVVFLGMSTHKPLVNALSSLEVLDGTLNRFLFIRSELERGTGWNDDRETRVPEHLRQTLLKLAQFPKGQTIDASRCLTRLHVFRDEADLAVPLNDWGPVWTRAYENAIRISGLCALSEALKQGGDLSRVEVFPEHVDYAVAFVRSSVESMIAMCRDDIADSYAERTRKQLLKLIKGMALPQNVGKFAPTNRKTECIELNRQGWVTLSQVSRGSQNLSKAERDSAIAQLVEAEQLLRGESEDGTGVQLFKAID